MKRRILTIILSALALTLNAQPPVDNLNKLNMNPQKIKPGILSDKTDTQNQRIIYGKAQMVNNLPDEDAEKIIMGKPIPTAITTQAFYKNEQYGITINMVRMKKRAILSEAPVLIKTQNGTVIETKTLEGSNPEETYQTVVNISMTTKNYSEPRYKMYCHIILTPSMIDQIENEGISKLRIQTDQDYYDIELKKDNLSQFYIEELHMIAEALTTSKGFRDGF